MDKFLIDVTVEIPKSSKIKYEYDRKTSQIRVDRILFGSESYPQNYGFIANTLDWDGDELDCFIFADQAFLPGVVVPTRIVGALEMVDDGELDTKLLGVIDCDPRYKEINSVNDLPKHRVDEIIGFFKTYKLLQKKEVIIKGVQSLEWAKKEYQVCVDLMKQYGKLPKDEFIAKMQKLHPEHYQK
ncbi:inorganic diphosphatase [Mycoplasmoides pneumoniae]|uniref:Inorganic pyrophosphatase n=3 Tax=Mycoplasmoides pneumoniae TaxID=2104 RepID=A0AAV5N8E4_MYCPM|nr:inorganic diphosphatase [Mycoplasmoides pneumoniae]ADK86747.1 inorganic diphosphatase [Mycoplasmoides pneumoniae FH]ALA30688.1 inorganic pyrophosphatase [Mycoplasmoides pneumoniae 19294]ALA31793.1 inorganic pyrophosphatase [Mycoplasmoides pneumoniae 39443]ALA36022.1 inorganic pyrophosphatase [Mycoplasmoides pneumoniae FH]ALA36732.1 inorganic pyrophosphatase [Mycoplasmoides pneumoniae M1139]